MSKQSQHLYEFGQFRLDAGERLLLRDGVPVPLQPKAFDTLLVLVENGGRLVEKDDLMKAIWPDSFVEEVNLSSNISLLRKALGDRKNGHPPQYIETVPKRGYRFVAPVVEVAGEAAAAGAELLVERRRSAEIVTEEVEEIVKAEHLSADKTTFARVDVPPMPAVGPVARLNLKSRRRTLTVAAMFIAVALTASLVYLWASGRSQRAAATVPIKSIAVLPFKDLSANGVDEHLGMGLADVLITRLSNIRELNVRPTSAVLALGGQEQDSLSAGRRLGVDAVLEGTIYRAGDRVRVTARLMKVSDGMPLWAGQFEKPLRDELEVQDELALQLVDALALPLSNNEQRALTKRYTESADAYQLYLKGRYYWNKRSSAGMSEAERLFRNAIERDPNFALAHVGLADTLMMRSAVEMNHAVAKALDLDPQLAEAHATLGFIQIIQWKWAEAEASFKKSIELSPNYATAHHWYATLLGIEGRTEEAKAEMRRALEINPLSYNFLADLGQAHYFAREYKEAEEYCLKALAVYPDFVFAHKYLIDIYLQTGEYEKAITAEINYAGIEGAFPSAPVGDREHFERAILARRDELRQIGLKGYLHRYSDLSSTPEHANNFYGRARIYAFLGEKGKALENLEKAHEGRAFLLAFVKADPVFDGLRAKPRYQEILRRMNLTP